VEIASFRLCSCIKIGMKSSSSCSIPICAMCGVGLGFYSIYGNHWIFRWYLGYVSNGTVLPRLPSSEHNSQPRHHPATTTSRIFTETTHQSTHIAQRQTTRHQTNRISPKFHRVYQKNTIRIRKLPLTPGADVDASNNQPDQTQTLAQF